MLQSCAARTIGLVRRVARIADLLLVAFLVCLALTTAAQVRHNEAAGPRGHAPHDRPVATARPGR
jgi:peptidoglycan/LPS O-acetylase OafA/YrhL